MSRGGLLKVAQERLTFLAQQFIRDEIQGFIPTKEDLDYPNRLSVASNCAQMWPHYLTPLLSIGGSI